MLVRERMISTGTRVSANVPISSLNGNFDNISSSWVPVVDQEGSLVGLLTVADLKTAKETIKKLPPEDRSGPTVRDFMTTKFLFVNENTPIEEAVRMMIDYDTDELPVVKDGYFSGVITEKIMLRVLMEITGARRQGIRLMVEVKNTTGSMLDLLQLIAEQKGNVQGFCTYCASDDELLIVTMRVEGVDKYSLKQAIKTHGYKVIDIR